MEHTQSPTVDLQQLRFEQGGHLLVKHALRSVPVGEKLRVCGTTSDLPVHLRVWCRHQGHSWTFETAPASEHQPSPQIGWITRGSADVGRWKGSQQTGLTNPKAENAIAEHPPGTWGLAARGARVEAGVPDFQFGWKEKEVVWTEQAPRLYAQAAAAQWDPNTAVPWDAEFTLPDEVEDAIVQVMTYLVENETVALMVPARFLANLHPHFREIMQLLAIQAADEARHIEVFTRRASLKRDVLGLSTVGGQTSLKTLLDEPDFALAFFLLSVLGEGTFLSLLWFIRDHAPDPVTEAVARMSAQDEARHVAFGMAHLTRHIELDPTLHQRLANAVHMRHAALEHTAGLNEEVFDSLLLLAAGSWNHDDILRGYNAVMKLQEEMDTLRQRRLIKLGFPEEQAAEISALHTRNFM
ncbi:MAG: ferritin-like domain-containing protein [Deltaproteobacteria bacterium]|nr:MAG: ferritin-like domain-containing protein [Deltaproteobacteria bacterium]